MARARHAASAAFDAITIEGSLIAPAMLAQIAADEAGQQAEADYAIPAGLALRDEIARYFRIGQALYREAFAQGVPTAARTSTFVKALLKDVLGFADIAAAGIRSHEGRNFPVTLEAAGGRVPVIIVPPGDELDRASAALSPDGRRRSAASALQDWLNVNDAALWGLACNGQTLRLMRDNASLTRPAYLEADLKHIFDSEDFASFAALWLTIHATRFGASGAPSDCILERWRDAGAKEGVAARDRLRDGVEAALLALGNGLVSHPANAQLRQRLADGSLPLPDFFVQLLRLIYRLIFLMVVEDRALLHVPSAPAAARKLYADGYSLAALRARSVRRAAWDRYGDKWQGLKIVMRGLAVGEPKLGLPGLAGLFAHDATPDLDSAELSNRALLEAIFRLAWLREDAVLSPVNWRAMETEELGSVYESLLELTPRLTDAGRGFAFAEGGETRGNARKTSGSYYTPDSLVQLLLDSALDPVLDKVEADGPDPAAQLLTVTVVDPACGSGHFLLAAARRIAARVARARAGGVASGEDYRRALRDVARHCIHGVDRNPMAVELTKVALWIETVEPGKPLGFLDANIRCGDALLGVFDLEALRKGVPDAAYKPLAGDDKPTAKYYERRNKDERAGQGALDLTRGGGALPAPPPLAAAVLNVRALPEDSVADLAEKQRRFAAALNDKRLTPWRTAADLYVAAFIAPKTGGAPQIEGRPAVPTTGAVWKAISGQSNYGPMEGAAVALSHEARAFHWPLEFPHIFGAGGFGAVIGNPPWERIKLQEQEFFAAREPEIAEAPNAAARGRLIAALGAAPAGSRERALFAAFETAKRVAEASSAFVRVNGDEGGRFALTGRGDVNTYALFAELFVSAVSPRGRAGVIVPTGIATDATTAPFFAALVDQKRLASLIDFENREKIFQAVDSRMKFSLLTVGRNLGTASFAFFLTDPTQLAEADRNFMLTPEDIARINPNTKTAPVFRSRRDAELTAKIYGRVPVLIDESKGSAGNPWGLSFGTMFHMSNDSGLFRTAAQLRQAGYRREGVDWVKAGGVARPQPTLDLIGGRAAGALDLGDGSSTSGRYVPLYEAKMIHQFDHRWATYDGTGSRDVTDAEKADPNFEATPRYWVPHNEVDDRLAAKNWSRDWLMGWRDVTNATNERTVISAAFPRSAVNHKAPLYFSERPTIEASFLIATLNSLVLDFCARQKIGGTSLTFFYLKQFAVPPPEVAATSDLTFISERILELSYTSHAMGAFAKDLGYNGAPFDGDTARRAQLRAELDARIARLYGLTRDELRYILDPTDVMGADYPSETFRVLKKNEIAKFGEYRTARLVLQAWDAEEAGGS